MSPTALTEIGWSAPALLPVVKDLKDYIERSARLYMLFHQMWEQENKLEYPGHRTLLDYDQMFLALNDALRQAPEWNTDTHAAGSAGLPFCDIFYYVAATPSGYAAFTDPGVARMLKKMLCHWGEFLASSESTKQLHGWLSEDGARDVLAKAANAPYGTDLTFAELFDCDTTQKFLGYKSWDDFFIRKFRAGVRPVAAPEDDGVVVNACESKCYNVAHDLQMHDRFWAKDRQYSLTNMLGNESDAALFEGGTLYQAFLSTYSYHRWHAPVSGTVRKAYSLEGTYFAIPEFDSPESRAHRQKSSIDPDEWQTWLSAVSTRGVVLIEADNADLGIVAFIAIGIVEVSTIDVRVEAGQHVKKGDEIGMFHFGGSSYCLLFQRGVPVSGLPIASQSGHNLAVGAKLASLKRSVEKT